MTGPTTAVYVGAATPGLVVLDLALRRPSVTVLGAVPGLDELLACEEPCPAHWGVLAHRQSKGHDRRQP